MTILTSGINHFKGPKFKAGPASSKSANKDEEPPKTPISLKLTTKKAGPASKVKKSDTGDTPGPASKVNKNDDSCKLSFDTSSDSDGDSPKAKTPKVKMCNSATIAQLNSCTVYSVHLQHLQSAHRRAA